MREFSGAAAFHRNSDISTCPKIQYSLSETVLQHLSVFTPVCVTVFGAQKVPFFCLVGKDTVIT